MSNDAQNKAPVQSRGEASCRQTMDEPGAKQGSRAGSRVGSREWRRSRGERVCPNVVEGQTNSIHSNEEMVDTVDGITVMRMRWTSSPCALRLGRSGRAGTSSWIGPEEPKVMTKSVE